MVRSSYVIRRFCREDRNRLVRWMDEVQKSGSMGSIASPYDLLEHISKLGHGVDNDIIIAERSGQIVGCGDIRPEMSIGRVVLTWLIHPHDGAEEVFAVVVDHALRRTQELGFAILHVSISRKSLAAGRLLLEKGFTLVRRFLELRIDLFCDPLPETLPTSLECRPARANEVQTLVELQNRSFDGAWGYHPNSVEEITCRLNLPYCSPEDVILAFREHQPVGYCWVRREYWKTECSGRIYMLGVDPDNREGGVGRQILLAGLAYLRTRGLHDVAITVDSENKSALALYRSVGFRPWTSSLWYEKLIKAP